MSLPIVCLAHGSRHPRADDAVAELCQALGGHAQPAYLDFNPRTLTNVAHLLAAQGHAEAVVVPLLFTDAFHMRHDVPEAIAEAEAATGVTLHLARGLGTGGDMVEIAAAHTREHLRREHTQLAVFNVGKPVPDIARALADALGLDRGRSFSFGQEDQLLDFADPTTTCVVPLFVCPGILWDGLCHRMPSGLARAPHLGAAIAPAVHARAESAR